MVAFVACLLVVRSAVILHRGTSFHVRLDPNAKHPLQIWSDTHKITETLIPAHHPWALQIADVDGDGIDDIVVGLNESTRYLKFPHHTLFIMRFDGSHLVRKWAGSTLGRPFTEFCFGPRRPGSAQLLFTLDQLIDGKIALTAHKWSGFGFQRVGRELTFEDASSLRLDHANLIVFSNHCLVTIPYQGLL